MKRLRYPILAVLLIAALFSGCGTKGGKAKDTLTVMAAFPAQSMDPCSGKMGDRLAYHAMFDTIVNYDDKGGVRPNIAASWTKSDDGMTYTFTLREDVKFHDGTTLTADDVIYTFDSMMATPMYRQFYQVYTKWEKVDARTVRFTAATPAVNLPATLATMGFIVPKAARSADPAAFEAKPIGSGPFKFVSRAADGAIEAEAFGDYFRGKPAFAKVVVKPPVEPSTAVVALQNGEVDLVTNIPAAQTPLIKADKKLELVELSGWSFYALGLMGPQLRDDPELRKAIYHGIDREKMVQVASEGVGKPASDFINTRVLGAAAGSIKDYVGYDQAMAKDFLGKSKYKPGAALSITVMPTESAMAQSIQDDLKKIGITLEIEQLDVNAWGEKVMKGTAQMTILPFGSAGEDSPVGILSVLSKTYPYLGKDMYSTPEYEDLIARIKGEPDAAKRGELAKEAVRLQYSYANLVSLFDSMSNFARSRSVANIDPMSAATTVYYLGDFKPGK